MADLSFFALQNVDDVTSIARRSWGNTCVSAGVFNHKSYGAGAPGVSIPVRQMAEAVLFSREERRHQDGFGVRWSFIDTVWCGLL